MLINTNGVGGENGRARSKGAQIPVKGSCAQNALKYLDARGDSLNYTGGRQGY